MILSETAAVADRIGRGDIRPRIRAMTRAFPEAMITGWADCIADLDLPDPDDAHVVAAALAAGASLIITFNLKDFPSSHLPDGMAAIDPDALRDRVS
jgi:hypothetical protein